MTGVKRWKNYRIAKIEGGNRAEFTHHPAAADPVTSPSRPAANSSFSSGAVGVRAAESRALPDRGEARRWQCWQALERRLTEGRNPPRHVEKEAVDPRQNIPMPGGRAVFILQGHSANTCRCKLSVERTLRAETPENRNSEREATICFFAQPSAPTRVPSMGDGVCPAWIRFSRGRRQLRNKSPGPPRANTVSRFNARA